MPSKRISSFIAQKKLGELQASRERLLAAYQAIEDRADAAAPDDVLRVLAEGLAALKHGNNPVHPEVVNLEVTLGDPRAPHDRWLDRLRRVVREGRARADVTALYGGALAEWLAPARRKHVPTDEALAALRSAWTVPSAPSSLWALVEPRLDPDRCARARARVAERVVRMRDPTQMHAPDPDVELLTPAARADARSLPRDEADPAVLEFHAAFRLAWATVSDWDWPEGGVALEAGWTGQRFRLRPKMDFLTACTVEAIGDSVGLLVDPWLHGAWLRRRLRLLRLEELNAPEIIVENERRMLEELPDPLGPGEDPFLAASGARWTESIAGVRANRAAGPDEGEPYSGGQLGAALAQLWGDVQVARAAGQPLHVYKTDLADFFPSVSHALVDDVLAGVGVPPDLRALVLRVLSLRLPDGTRTARGLPLCLTLSRVIAGLIVEVVLSEVRSAARVDAAALVDDIVLSSPDPVALERARAALERALGAAGLALNPAKTGWFAVGAAVHGPPLQWGLLELADDGWKLAAAPFDAFVAATRTHVAEHDALLDRVSAWRGQLSYLWTSLAPASDLGPRYFDTVRAALDAMRSLSLPASDGTEHAGIAAMLRHELGARFLDGAGAVVPDGWLHWPISAGGLGLHHPPADLVPLELAARVRTSVALPKEPCSLVDPAWGRWYADRLVPLTPSQPAPSPVLDGFIARFVQRGARLGQAQGELSPYWRWVLTTFGPDVLDAFGSFDFVSTDLVPVSLIRESLGGRTRRSTPGEDVPF